MNVANLLIDGFPPEHDDTPLAWDNVVYRGTGLGYVVANHQDIRVGPPAQSVFTAYVAEAPPPPLPDVVNNPQTVARVYTTLGRVDQSAGSRGSNKTV